MNPLPKAFLSASILALGLATAPVIAQNATSQTPTRPHSAAPKIQPNDAQLKSFAQASQKVAMVAEEYQPKLHASPDDSARQKVMQEAEEKMIQLVSVEGLTVDEYNGINEAVQQDPKMQQRVIDLVNKSGG